MNYGKQILTFSILGKVAGMFYIAVATRRILDKSEFENRRHHSEEFARGQARLMEATAGFCATRNQDHLPRSTDATGFTEI